MDPLSANDDDEDDEGEDGNKGHICPGNNGDMAIYRVWWAIFVWQIFDQEENA